MLGQNFKDSGEGEGPFSWEVDFIFGCLYIYGGIIFLSLNLPFCLIAFKIYDSSLPSFTTPKSGGAN